MMPIFCECHLFINISHKGGRIYQSLGLVGNIRNPFVVLLLCGSVIDIRILSPIEGLINVTRLLR